MKIEPLKTFLLYNISMHILICQCHLSLGGSRDGQKLSTNQVITHLAGRYESERVSGPLASPAVPIGSDRFLVLVFIEARTTHSLRALITVHNIL